jgi:RNA polymerase sigma-70 factor, ECF subfamily
VYGTSTRRASSLVFDIKMANPGEGNKSSGRRRPPLTLVASSDAAGAQPGRGGDARGAGGRDWSHLMARAQDGDRDAYRTLLEDITPYLRALAARCFRDTGDIEDAVQDALLTVHAVRHAYDPGRPFGPWLAAIANRRIIDRLRRQIRVRSREIELTAEHETFSAHQTNLQSNLAETSADEAVLHAAIEHLPPDQRQAIRLLKLKEMSLNEAALASGKSVSALKVATHRAIKSLRKLLRQPSQTP